MGVGLILQYGLFLSFKAKTWLQPCGGFWLFASRFRDVQGLGCIVNGASCAWLRDLVFECWTEHIYAGFEV